MKFLVVHFDGGLESAVLASLNEGEELVVEELVFVVGRVRLQVHAGRIKLL